MHQAKCHQSCLLLQLLTMPFTSMMASQELILSKKPYNSNMNFLLSCWFSFYASGIAANLQYSITSILKWETQSVFQLNDPEAKYTKTHGVEWLAQTDHFRLPVSEFHTHKKLIKRALVFDIARTYNILGWFSPVIITAKIFCNASGMSKCMRRSGTIHNLSSVVLLEERTTIIVEHSYSQVPLSQRFYSRISAVAWVFGRITASIRRRLCMWGQKTIMVLSWHDW